MSGFIIGVCFSLEFFLNKDGELVSKANKQIKSMQEDTRSVPAWATEFKARVHTL